LRISASFSVDSGVISEGLRTIVQPAASGAASFQESIISG
jgi:hypothetical protein